MHDDDNDDGVWWRMKYGDDYVLWCNMIVMYNDDAGWWCGWCTMTNDDDV